MILFDSQTGLFHACFRGAMGTHGTPFRHAVEQELLDPHRVTMIGILGTARDRECCDFADGVGMRLMATEDVHVRGVVDVMAEARERAGQQEAYISTISTLSVRPLPRHGTARDRWPEQFSGVADGAGAEGGSYR